MQPVSDHYYRDIFNSEFNVGFEPPHLDMCSTCDLYTRTISGLSVQTDAEQIARLQELKSVHKADATQVHTILKQCKDISDPTVCALCFDLQQTLPTPKLSTGIQYYKCKLWTYITSVYIIY